ASIEGRVVNPDGSPASFQWISANRADPKPGGGGGGGSGQPRGDGAFVIGGLEAGVTYLLQVSGSNGRPMTNSPRVEARAKAARIVVTPPVKLTGRVDGVAPGVDWWVSAWPVGGSPDAARSSARVGADGSFSLDVAPDKDYVLGALSQADDRYAILS